MTVVDPSSKNKIFPANNVFEYVLEYTKALSMALSEVSKLELDNIFNLIQIARENNNCIWVAGNGGSASIAEHLCCDFTKGTGHSSHKSLKTHSLISNTSMLTAIANDYGYEDVFCKQLEMLSKKEDIVILISSSGNSKNVINAAEWANSNGLTTVSFTGFSGGLLSKISKYNLHLPFENYGIVEDAHQILMHCFSQFISSQNKFSKL